MPPSEDTRCQAQDEFGLHDSVQLASPVPGMKHKFAPHVTDAADLGWDASARPVGRDLIEYSLELIRAAAGIDICLMG